MRSSSQGREGLLLMVVGRRTLGLLFPSRILAFVHVFFVQGTVSIISWMFSATVNALNVIVHASWV